MACNQDQPMDKYYSKEECLKRIDWDHLYTPDKGSNELVKEMTAGDNNAVLARCLREVAYLTRMNHPNIIKLKKVDNTTLNMVLEFMNDNLKEYLELRMHQGSPLNSQTTKSIIGQILAGLSHCHDRNIVHRDVQPLNILLHILKDSSNNLPDTIDIAEGVKLGNFGSARSSIFPWDLTPVENFQSLWYRAPELIFGLRDYLTQADVWSAGCVFAEMVYQNPLFPGADETDQLRRIFRIMGTPNEENWPGITALYADLNQFEKAEPTNLGDMFLGLEPDGVDLLSKMLCLNPSTRISASDALRHAYFR